MESSISEEVHRTIIESGIDVKIVPDISKTLLPLENHCFLSWGSYVINEPSKDHSTKWQVHSHCYGRTLL